VHVYNRTDVQSVVLQSIAEKYTQISCHLLQIGVEVLQFFSKWQLLC